jgi:gliding motility-associated-like protein
VVVELFLPLLYDMPNIFTPNGDNINDFFTINPENAIELDMVIVNRWGNVVFESNDVNAVWNGRNRNDGAMCSPGTYFYKFRIVGMDGEEKTEHGFVQLVTD